MADDPITRSEIAARLDAAEAHTDTKFAQLIGKIETSSADLKGEIGKISARLDSVERSTAGTKTTIIVTAIGIVAVIAAILGYGQQWFGIGVTTRDIIRATVTEIHQQEEPPIAGQKK